VPPLAKTGTLSVQTQKGSYSTAFQVEVGMPGAPEGIGAPAGAGQPAPDAATTPAPTDGAAPAPTPTPPAAPRGGGQP